MIVCTTQYPYLIYDSAHIIEKRKTKDSNCKRTKVQIYSNPKERKCKRLRNKTRMKKTRQQYESTNISGILYTQGKRTTSGRLLLGFLIHAITLQPLIVACSY